MSRSRSLIYAGLFAPLLLLSAVTAMTSRAERRYERVTERVVHDYAAIAAWQYARRATGALHEESMQAFRGIATGHMRMGPAPAPLAQPGVLLAARGDSASDFLNRATLAFTWDATSRRASYAGDAGHAALRRKIEDRMANVRTPRQDGEPHHMFFEAAGGKTYAIALWTLHGPDGMRGAYGVVSDPATLHARLERALAEGSLLPATAASPGPGDLSVRLARHDGGVVFAVGDEPGATAATDSAGVQQGELRTTIDISPRLASALLASAPASQLPALGLMLLVAGALAAVGVRQERKARELEAMRTRFVANVSHELRTPLAQISMFAETLELGRERGEGERRQFAGIILAEARRLTALVESVLSFSRGPAPGLRLSALGLGDELRSAVDAYAPIAQTSGVRIEYEANADLTAKVDPGALRQVMLNLLDNAVKHGGRDGTVRVSLRGADAGAEIVVDDAGRGIPARERERVFEPFVQLETGGTGAGIGLAVVRDLVKAHGGSVRIEDAPGGGARFIVTLPRAESREPTARSPELQAESSRS